MAFVVVMIASSFIRLKEVRNSSSKSWMTLPSTSQVQPGGFFGFGLCSQILQVVDSLISSPGEALKPEDSELPELDAVSFLEVSKKRSCWDWGYWASSRKIWEMMMHGDRNNWWEAAFGCWICWMILMFFDFWLVEGCFFSWGVSFVWSDGDG